jgi:beta-lactamase class A
MDVNKDGILDIILGGNQYEFKPQFGRLDTNFGSLLLGTKKGTFTWTSYDKSGFYLKGEVKHIQKIKNKNNTASIIAVINDATPKIFKIND